MTKFSILFCILLTFTLSFACNTFMCNLNTMTEDTAKEILTKNRTKILEHVMSDMKTDYNNVDFQIKLFSNELKGIFNIIKMGILTIEKSFMDLIVIFINKYDCAHYQKITNELNIFLNTTQVVEFWNINYKPLCGDL